MQISAFNTYICEQIRPLDGDRKGGLLLPGESAGGGTGKRQCDHRDHKCGRRDFFRADAMGMVIHRPASFVMLTLARQSGRGEDHFRMSAAISPGSRKESRAESLRLVICPQS